jgi:hypothetical protein
MDAARKREGYFFAKRPAGGPWSNAITANVHFGSLTDISQRNRHVRFTPESRHWRLRLECPLRARSGHVRHGVVHKHRDHANSRNTIWKNANFDAPWGSPNVVSVPVQQLMEFSKAE